MNKKSIETNTKINEANLDLSDEIKKVDDKLDILSKVPFQFEVASIIATDQVESLGKTIIAGPHKDVSYDILSRITHNIKCNSLKALGVRNFYLNEFNNNILVPNVG